VCSVAFSHADATPRSRETRGGGCVSFIRDPFEACVSCDSAAGRYRWCKSREESQ
jgi:hypothetical protein